MSHLQWYGEDGEETKKESFLGTFEGGMSLNTKEDEAAPGRRAELRLALMPEFWRGFPGLPFFAMRSEAP